MVFGFWWGPTHDFYTGIFARGQIRLQKNRIFIWNHLRLVHLHPSPALDFPRLLGLQNANSTSRSPSNASKMGLREKSLQRKKARIKKEEGKNESEVIFVSHLVCDFNSGNLVEMKRNPPRNMWWWPLERKRIEVSKKGRAWRRRRSSKRRWARRSNKNKQTKSPERAQPGGQLLAAANNFCDSHTPHTTISQSHELIKDT